MNNSGFNRMNIFVLSLSPRLSAQYHCDKHVVKMILETAQVLYSVHWTIDPLMLLENAYKKTHVNHPCSVWARTSIANYRWLCELGVWLCKEYTFRYNNIHATQKHIEWLTLNIPNIENQEATPFALAMPDEYKCESPVESYRAFYRESKMKQRNIVGYTRRKFPPFLQNT